MNFMLNFAVDLMMELYGETLMSWRIAMYIYFFTAIGYWVYLLFMFYISFINDEQRVRYPRPHRIFKNEDNFLPDFFKFDNYMLSISIGYPVLFFLFYLFLSILIPLLMIIWPVYVVVGSAVSFLYFSRFMIRIKKAVGSIGKHTHEHPDSVLHEKVEQPPYSEM